MQGRHSGLREIRNAMKKLRLLNSGYGSLADKSPSSILQYKIRVAFPMAMYMIFYCVTFAVIENWNRVQYTVIHNKADNLIPFCEIFIIPYLLWFAYSVGFTVYMLLTDEKSYHEVCTFLAIGMTVFLVVSALFPNILVLRPDVMPRSNVFTRLCRVLYAVDTPTNVTPSIHVYNSLCVMIAAWKTDAPMMRAKANRIFMTVFGFLIILSTMFLKQHSFSDVINAIMLALISYILIYRIGFVFVGSDRRKVLYKSVFEH